MTGDIELLISPTGRIVFIHDDDIAEALYDLGVPVTRRASHVEPHPDHPGKWMADMTLTTKAPVILGPFDSRREALSREVEYLRQHPDLLI